MTYTLTNLKGKAFLNLDTKDADTALQSIMDDVLAQAVGYMENEGITTSTVDTYPDVCRALLKQCAFEWKRRNELGLASVTFPDGSINRYDIGEWLPEVEKIVDRYRVLTI
jgi:hypothetical protein